MVVECLIPCLAHGNFRCSLEVLGKLRAPKGQILPLEVVPKMGSFSVLTCHQQDGSSAMSSAEISDLVGSPECKIYLGQFLSGAANPQVLP